MAGDARKRLETQLGESIVTSDNHLNIKSQKTNELPEKGETNK